MTPLHWAAYNNDEEVINYLLSKGVVMLEDKDGNTPLDTAGNTEQYDVNYYTFNMLDGRRVPQLLREEYFLSRLFWSS